MALKVNIVETVSLFYIRETIFDLPDEPTLTSLRKVSTQILSKRTLKNISFSIVCSLLKKIKKHPLTPTTRSPLTYYKGESLQRRQVERSRCYLFSRTIALLSWFYLKKVPKDSEGNRD